MAELRTRDYVPVEVAVLLSLLLHALAFVSWQYRGVLLQLPFFHSLAALVQPAHPLVARPPAPAPTITFVEVPATTKTASKRRPEDRQQFMETDASQPASATPKNAKFYSNKSTQAANPENPTGKIDETPYLEGKDTRMKSTQTVVPSSGSASTPAMKPSPPHPPAPPPMPVVAAKPQPPTPKLVETPKPPAPPPKKIASEGTKVVDAKPAVQEHPPAPDKQVALLSKPVEPVTPMVPPTPIPPTPTGPAVEPTPPPSSGMAGSDREIAALKSRMSASGTKRIGIAAFNVAGSPFGDYDKALIRAVQSRWYALIQQDGLYDRAGTVTLHFNLLADGSIQPDEKGGSGIKIKENSAGEILGLFCEKAVVDSAPFPRLPDELQTLIGNEPREVNFTFYY